MYMSFENVVLVLAGVSTGLHAGLLYDFSVDIVPSMRKLGAKAHIEMFQAIDKTITNPVFFLSFFGPIVLLPLATVLLWGEPQGAWLLIAAVVQIVGCNGATVAGNLPLNAELVKVDTAKISDAEAVKIRQAFQGRGSRWMVFHTIRTIAGTAATALIFAIGLSL
jgi:uncharacterized membrane protein